MTYSKLTQDLIQWIKDWFKENGEYCNAIIGVSGGAKSTIAVAIMTEALGKDRVIGVIMRDKVDSSADDAAISVCKHYNIRYYSLPIYPSVNAIRNLMNLECKLKISERTVKNLPARMRMTALYAVSQSLNGRVINTSSLSDNYIGNVTRWGDSCGDMSPFGLLTTEEMLSIGSELGVPQTMLFIPPFDELPASEPDEKRLGFTYIELDKYIRTGEIDNNISKNRINALFKANAFKKFQIDTFNPQLDIHIL